MNHTDPKKMTHFFKIIFISLIYSHCFPITSFAENEITQTKTGCISFLEKKKSISDFPVLTPDHSFETIHKEKFTNFLKNDSEIYLKNIQPQFEEILLLNLHNDPTSQNLKASHLINILKLFKQTPERGTYLFLGNGQYPLYLMMKSIFQFTPLFDDLIYLPISRGITDGLNKEFSYNVYPLFDFYQLDKRTGNFYIFDSVSIREKENEHSVLILSQHLRKYLLSKHWELETIKNRVISVGMKEPDKLKSSFEVPDLKSYREKLKNYQLNDLYLMKPSFAAPLLMTTIEWNTEIFNHYDFRGESYWGGKYATLNDDNFPKASIRVTSENQHDFKKIIEKRIKLGKKYRKIIFTTQERVHQNLELMKLVNEILIELGYIDFLKTIPKD